MPVPYLVGLSLDGRRVVLIGAGAVVARRLPLLIQCGARVHLVAPDLHPSVAEWVDAGTVTHDRRRYRSGDLAQAWYAMAATDDAQVNAAVVAEAEDRRVFCVRADIGSAGTAVTPASGVLPGPSAAAPQLQLAVLAGGDHRRSRAVRDRMMTALTSWVAETAPEI